MIKASAGVQHRFLEITGVEVLPSSTPEQILNKILFTYFFPMTFSSSSKQLSDEMAHRINSNHHEFSIQKTFDFIKTQVQDSLSLNLNFKTQGGSPNEDLALQNLQARSRLVLSYFISQILPLKHNLKSFLLVMATGNLSEVLRGYYTKYDNSSGDLDLVGSLNKEDVWRVLHFGHKNLPNFEILKKLAEVAPTA